MGNTKYFIIGFLSIYISIMSFITLILHWNNHSGVASTFIEPINFYILVPILVSTLFTGIYFFDKYTHSCKYL
jgi:hypothetical protein